jgi:putative ABC transport system permease protein
VIEGFVQLGDDSSRVLRLLGVDPFSERSFRSYVGEGLDLPVLQRFLVEPGAILLSSELAGELGLRAGDSIALASGARNVNAFVAGLLSPADNLAKRSLRGMLIVDISTAQEVLDMPGRLSRIDVIIDEGNTAAARELTAALPPGLLLQNAETRSSAIASMTDAFSLNLTALSLLALVVGMFLIYDTVSFSVVQRREQFGILRAIGASRRQIAVMILSETFVLAAFGTTLGLFLGVLLGNGALDMVTRTISDLYTTMTATEVTLPFWTFVKGSALGLAASLLAALPPAREAMRSQPAGVLRRTGLEDRLRGILPRLTLTGLSMLALSALLVFLPHDRVDLSFAAVFLLLVGMSFLIPVTVRAVMRAGIPVFRRVLGITGVMAARNISRSLSRTTVAIAALMVAVSVIVGVNTMIGSFRQTVEDWLSTTLAADIFVTLPFRGAGQNDGADPELAERILDHPGIDRVATARTLALASAEYGNFQLVAVSDDIADRRPYKWRSGSRAETWKSLENGAVLVSEPFAFRHGIDESNAEITLMSDRGARRFVVAGVYYDYSTDKGTVLMDDAVYRRSWDDRKISSVAAFVTTGENVDRMMSSLRRDLDGGEQVVVQSNRGLRNAAMDVFDRTFTITAALQLLAAIVAFIGVFNALMALQLERSREIGTLRATGMSRRQLTRTILTETGMMGVLSGLLALPVGFVMALILIFVINLRSFGWTLTLHVAAMDLVQAFLVAVAAAMLAGIYPALRFGRVSPAEALRAE